MACQKSWAASVLFPKLNFLLSVAVAWVKVDLLDCSNNKNSCRALPQRYLESCSRHSETFQPFHSAAPLNVSIQSSHESSKFSPQNKLKGGDFPRRGVTETLDSSSLSSPLADETLVLMSAVLELRSLIN